MRRAKLSGKLCISVPMTASCFSRVDGTRIYFGVWGHSPPVSAIDSFFSVMTGH